MELELLWGGGGGGCCDSRDQGDQHRLPRPVSDSRHYTVPANSHTLGVSLMPAG